MISRKLIWFLLVQLSVFKGCFCLDTNETIIENVLFAQNATFRPESELKTNTNTPTIEISTAQNKTLQNQFTSKNSTNATEENKLELLEIFHGSLNTTTEQITVNTTIICMNKSSENLTCVDKSWNDTIKSNYTTVAEAVEASGDSPAFRLENTAAIAAGVFLVSAVIGYSSCVGYRRFLQRKYGNSQILVGEEVYDTTDLRYFEI